MLAKLLDVAIPQDVKNEIGEYLSIIEKDDISNDILDLITSRLKLLPIDADVDAFRVNCRQSIIGFTGLRIIKGNVDEYSSDFCEYVVKTYVSFNYAKIPEYDRKVLHRFNMFDRCMLDCLIDYNHSKYFEESVLTSVLNIKHINSFKLLIDSFIETYPNMPRETIIKYILYYKEPLSRFGRNNDNLIDTARKLSLYGIDFFEFSDAIHSYEESLSNREFNLYVHKICTMMSKYNVGLADIFKGNIPSFAELEFAYDSLSYGIKVDIVNYRKDPVLYRENIQWARCGLVMKDYIKQGYVNIDQLQIIRKVLEAGGDPSEFGFKPSMHADKMRKIVDVKTESKLLTFATRAR